MNDTKIDVFHVYNRGNNGANILQKRSDKRAFLNIMLKCKDKFSPLIHHYQIMNNHYHIMLSAELEILPKIMRFIDLSFSFHHKRKYDHIGHLWQHRYGRKPINSLDYLLYLGAYIELNAVRKKMVSTPEEYEWSSYLYYAYGEPNSLLTPLPEYEALSPNRLERQRIYREYIYTWM